MSQTERDNFMRDAMLTEKAEEQRTLNLWIHTAESKLDVVVNPDSFPEVREGDFLEITQTGEAGIQRVVVHVKGFDKEFLAKGSQLQISITQDIANLYGLRRYLSNVKRVPKESVTADNLVLSLKDQYLSRSDMWRLQQSLHGSFLYVGRLVRYLNCIKAQVKFIYRHDELASHGYITPKTRIVFRSESAKYFIFVQMCKEMWDFDEDGEMFFEKAVYGFFPELFYNWKLADTNHVVSVVLFARVFYAEDTINFDDNCARRDDQGRWFKDYYKIVADWESRPDWLSLIIDMKEQCLRFQRDILMTRKGDKYILAGKNSLAFEGNVLEAVNMALNPFDKHFVDRDLLRTGLSIIMVTPGTGKFKVDRKLLRLTTERMTDNGVAMDLVCLSKPPLHVVPLFIFKGVHPPSENEPSRANGQQGTANDLIYNPHVGPVVSGPAKPSAAATDVWDPLYVDRYEEPEDMVYCSKPHWVDASFYTNQLTQPERQQFITQCKMYELQMMGVMEHEITSIAIPYLESNHSMSADDSKEIRDEHAKKVNSDYDDYDEAVFSGHLAYDTPLSVPIGMMYDRAQQRIKKSISISKSDSFPSVSDGSNEEPVDASGHRRISFLVDDSSSNLKTLNKTLQPNSNLTQALRKANDSHESKDLQVMNESKAIDISGQNLAAQRPNQVPSPGDGSFSPIKQSYTSEKGVYIRKLSRNARGGGTKPRKKQTVINPNNPGENMLEFTSHIRRWNHALPKPFSSQNDALIHWTSLITPACLPLTTDYKPSDEEFEHSYSSAIYTVSASEDGKVIPTADQTNHETAVKLLTELMLQRLAQGFQLVVTDSSRTSKMTNGIGRKIGYRMSRGDNYDFDDNGTQAQVLYLSLGNVFHRLKHEDSMGENVEMKRYTKEKLDYSTERLDYSCLVWPRNLPSYQPKSVSFAYPSYKYPWNYLDHLIAGYQDDFIDDLRYWRARFILIPMATLPLSTLSGSGKLDEEELRIELFRRFLENFEKVRLLSKQEKALYAQRKKKELPSDLRINYISMTPSVHLQKLVQSAHADSSIIAPPAWPVIRSEKQLSARELLNFTPEKYKTLEDYEAPTADQIKPALKIIAELLVDPQSGPPFEDRQWHYENYEDCAVGYDIVNFIIACFGDIDTRPDAVDFGNILFQLGLIRHLRQQHAFLDGLYFYSLTPQFSPPGGMKAHYQRVGFPATSSGHPSPQESFGAAKVNVGHRIPGSDVVEDKADKELIEVEMTKSIMINLDSTNGLSDRGELAVLHYDTFYNANQSSVTRNCYHFELDWLACTAPLIEDLLRSWRARATNCGLKLVEASIEQAYTDSENDNPFQSPMPVDLALPPPSVPESFQKQYPNVSIPQSYFEIELVRAHDFLLDVEADYRFPREGVELSWSYVKTPYKYDQYVHVSGVAFVQIRWDMGGFYWVNNRLYTSHTPSVQISKASNTSATASAEQLRKTFVQHCQDKQWLSQFWQEILTKLSTPSGIERLLENQIKPRGDPNLLTTHEDKLGLAISANGS